MAAGNGGGGVSYWFLDKAWGVVKAYGIIVIVIGLMSGMAAAATAASNIRMAGGETIGIVAGNLARVGGDIKNGQGLVKDSPQPASTPTPKKKN